MKLSISLHQWRHRMKLSIILHQSRHRMKVSISLHQSRHRMRVFSMKLSISLHPFDRRIEFCDHLRSKTTRFTGFRLNRMKKIRSSNEEKLYRKQDTSHELCRRFDYQSKGKHSVECRKYNVILSAMNHRVNQSSSQIFNTNHLKECLRSAHICPGGRLEFIVDSRNNSGLFHENGLQCSICKKITELTNFPGRPINELQEPNRRLYAAGAISGIGFDATNFILSLLGINTPHRANFFKQVQNL